MTVAGGGAKDEPGFPVSLDGISPSFSGCSSGRTFSVERELLWDDGIPELSEADGIPTEIPKPVVLLRGVVKLRKGW